MQDGAIYRFNDKYIIAWGFSLSCLFWHKSIWCVRKSSSKTEWKREKAKEVTSRNCYQSENMPSFLLVCEKARMRGWREKILIERYKVWSNFLKRLSLPDFFVGWVLRAVLARAGNSWEKTSIFKHIRKLHARRSDVSKCDKRVARSCGEKWICNHCSVQMRVKLRISLL